MPPDARRKTLLSQHLDALHAPYKVSSRVETKHHQVRTLLAQLGTRTLLVDEVHNIMAGALQRQRNFLNVIKYLSNDLQIPIVAIGTEAAVNAITTDDQLANRFTPVFLPVWGMNEDFLTLLASFESMLPLAKPSGLKGEKLSAELHRLSGGLIGELSTLLTMAARTAIVRGSERITLEIIRSLPFVPPKKRRDNPWKKPGSPHRREEDEERKEDPPKDGKDGQDDGPEGEPSR